MAAAIMTKKYTLDDFTNISFAGFNFIIDNETIDSISALAIEVGSPTYIKTPNFQKNNREIHSNNLFAGGPENAVTSYKKKRGNKGMEVTNDDWEAIRTFTATKIETKTGIDGLIDKIRLYLNKLTDKTYSDSKNSIIEILTKIAEDESNSQEMCKIGNAIFDIASNNRFYSKLYADLYVDLIDNFDIMTQIFETNLNEFIQLFDKIEFVNPDVDYERFCLININNEKRRAMSTFFVNLCINGIITCEKIVSILCHLLRQVVEMIGLEDKKNEVDELTENIILLFNKSFIETIDQNDEQFMIGSKTIIDTIFMIAQSKIKSYPSLTNKTIFKYMDLMDM